MTSVEWLFNELWETPKDKFEWYYILNKAKEMHNQEMSQLPQKEISDEEIEKASYKFWEFKEHTQSTCWKKGAKWYREQLKQRQCKD